MTELQRNILKNIVLYVLKDFSGGTDYIKLYKILYFANREQLATIGVPLINDKFKAWKLGPVPSFVGSVVKKIENDEPLVGDMCVFRNALKIRKNKLVVGLQKPDISLIPEKSRNLLDKYIIKCKYKNSQTLSKESHDVAWMEAYYRYGKVADGHSVIRPELMAAAGEGSENMIDFVRGLYSSDPSVSNFKNLKKSSSKFSETAIEIYNLTQLSEGWDGEDAEKINIEVGDNCRKLISSSRSKVALIDDVYPTPSGNICIDWIKNGNKTSAEIGMSKMAFYFTSADKSEIFDSPTIDVNDDSYSFLYDYIEKCDV